MLHCPNSGCSCLTVAFSLQSMFFSLEMHNGYLHVFYDFGFSNGPVHLEDTLKKAKINDARYHEVLSLYFGCVWVSTLTSVYLTRWPNTVSRITN